jgi:hypothetical protein
MKTHFTTLTIEHFRSLQRLQIEDLGRVNLITGRNNTGKSSILEGLRILASDASPELLASILRYREEDIGADGDESGRPIEAEGFFHLASLFNGFPQLSDTRESIRLAANGESRSMELKISVGLFSEEREPDGTRRLVPQQPQLFTGTELLPALIVEGGAGVRRILPLDYVRRFARTRPFRSDAPDESRLPCVFVNPYGGERTANLGVLWDKIALSDREKDVVEALQIIAPDIKAVSMVGGEGSRQNRTAIIRSNAFARPVPLRSFGDGLNRLFGIVLSLVNAKGGLLLIDEFENGMHHAVQLDVWRGIFRLAKLLKVQVFATSHSWDAVEAFQRAAAESPEEGVLIRLSKKGSSTVTTVFRENELAVVAREKIEVR